MIKVYSSGIKPVTQIKDLSPANPVKEKEMLEKMSQIQESYIDAAFRSVKRRFAENKNLRYEG
jgi:hypothetical protein